MLEPDLATLSAQVQDQFSTRVPIYDRRSAWIQDAGMIAAIVAQVPPNPSAKLLDVCCGTAAVSAAFAGRVGHRTGFDLTPAMLEVAKGRLDAVVQGDARHLPFEDASFDVVFSRQALHFFADPTEPIREMGRVLKPGGLLVLAQRLPWSEVDTAFWSGINFLKQPNLQTFLEERHILAGLEAAGCTLAQQSDYGLWESIHDWVASPEVSRERGEEILRRYAEAPAEVRAVHPIEERTEEGRVTTWACWRWGIFRAVKAS